MNEDFGEVEGEINGVKCKLIAPAVDKPTWTKKNLWNRSRIVSEDGEILSQSFGKFFNYTEQPDLYPDPNDFEDLLVEQKLDGSTCVVDWIGGALSMRTRESFNIESMANRNDFHQLTVLYPKVKQMAQDLSLFTFLFEITTPNHQIVIKYDEVDFCLIGAIHKEELKYMPPDALDAVAEMYGLKRPEKFKFNSLSTLVHQVKYWKDNEGVVVTYNNGANRVKVKSEDYCYKHYVVAGFKGKKRLLGMFEDLGAPSVEDFKKYFLDNFDFEVAEGVLENIQQIRDTYDEILQTIEDTRSYVESLPSDFTRKECAHEFNLRYKGWRNGLAFLLLDNAEIPVYKYLRNKLQQ